MSDRVGMAGELQDDYARHREALKTEVPWFAVFDAHVRGKRVRYRVSDIRSGDHHIVDWRSPIAQPYYEAAPGEAFETETKGGFNVVIEGVLHTKAAVFAKASRLTSVRVVDADGVHEVVATAEGFGSAAGAKAPMSLDGLPAIAALLTRQQYQLITSNRDRPLIIQGKAGSGKTSVALHRVAWLTYASDEPGAPPPVPRERVLVVMFNKALSTFVKKSVKDLGIEGVVVDTFHGWALQRIRDASRVEIEPTAGSKVPGHDAAVAIKKRLGTLRALDAFVARQEQALAKWLADRVERCGEIDVVERFRAGTEPVRPRLRRLRQTVKAAMAGAKSRELKRLEQAYEVLGNALSRMAKYKEDLLRFLCAGDLLAEHLPDVTRLDIERLAKYQHAMQTTEGKSGHPGSNVAWEDLALVLRLIQLRNGGFPDKDDDERAGLYEHLVIDEAQDFGALDLQVMLGAVRDRRSVTIAGDTNQKIVPAADFIGWAALAKELGIDGSEVTRLEVAHRATQAIMDVADTMVGDHTEGARPGLRPRYFQERTKAQVVTRLLELIDDHVVRDEAAHLCVVCPKPADAKALSAKLERVLDGVSQVRQGYGETFTFERGVTVTNYQQVKGLEFDAVIVVDPSAANYPVNDKGRGALYTVCTRAKERLDLVGAGPLTGLLDAATASGALEVVEAVKGKRKVGEDEGF